MMGRPKADPGENQIFWGRWFHTGTRVHRRTDIETDDVRALLADGLGLRLCPFDDDDKSAPVYHQRMKRPSSTGYGEKSFLDLCQSEVLDHIQVEMRQVRQLI
jgi:hypothetical protein